MALDAIVSRAGRGFTVREVAARLRVAPARVRTWLRRGELIGVFIDDSACRRRVIRIMPEALAEWERRRSTMPTPKPARKKRTTPVDYYPD